MNKKMLYSNFLVDLKDLYCKIGNKEVESCYLKFATVLSKKFSDWLISGDKPESIKNENVYEAIKLLAKIRKNIPYGGKLDSSYIVKNIAFENSSLVPSLWAFNNILNDVRVSEILKPFADLILTISKTLPQKKSDLDEKIVAQESQDAIDTLIGLYKEYEVDSFVISPVKTKKPTLAQKRMGMLRYLLNTFSDDIASACVASGLNDLSIEFKKGILAKPIYTGIGRLIETPQLSSSNVFAARKLVEICFENCDIKWGNYNHDYVELHLLHHIGSISMGEFSDIYKKHQETRDPMSYINVDTGDKFPGIDSGGKITYDKRLNPEYLCMLSVFFVEFQNRLNLPV